ncbi:MAG: carboxylating nicotinate-nucleotide diphosphorylase [Clostridia bacterium]|nr:carboxylating nicotinate-nucleotide diphosphorylase [Clostridia bacterium]
MLNQIYIDNLIKTALLEDNNYCDSASVHLLSEEQKDFAYFQAKDDGVLSGLNIAFRVFEILDSSFEYKTKFKDGDKVKKGDIIAEFSGKTIFLLQGERVALNILCHMSGIATATAKLVNLCNGTKASVADTRKTLPGLRNIEKYAVYCGGGKNHRYNLSDCAMLKDNHIDAAGGIKNAVSKIKSKLGHTVKIEVETRNLEEVRQALDSKADIIMLDNMTISQMQEAVSLIDGKAITEASGNVTEQTISEIAKTGVDVISSGALTHSAKTLDISMKFRA